MDNWTSGGQAHAFLSKLRLVLAHATDGTMEARSAGGTIRVVSERIEHIPQRTRYYFDDLAEGGRVPEGVTRDRFGSSFTSTRHRLMNGLTSSGRGLQRWKELTKDVLHPSVWAKPEVAHNL